MKKILIIGNRRRRSGLYDDPGGQCPQPGRRLLHPGEGPRQAKAGRAARGDMPPVYRGRRLPHGSRVEPRMGAGTGPTISARSTISTATSRRWFERLIAEEMADGECGAFLVWGDPTLYDSTIRIIDAIAAHGGHAFDYEVIPGISSVQALRPSTRRRSIASAGRSRSRRAESSPRASRPWRTASSSAAQDGYKLYADEDVDIYWGAYIGTPDEILVSGKLKAVAGEIERVRTAAATGERLDHGHLSDAAAEEHR